MRSLKISLLIIFCLTCVAIILPGSRAQKPEGAKSRAQKSGNAAAFEKSVLPFFNDTCYLWVVYGSSLRDGNTHSHLNLPVLLLGRGDGSIKPGRHIMYSEKPPMTNLFLTLLDRMGVPTEKLGDSSGKAEHLGEV